MFQDGKLTDRNAEMTLRKMLEEKKPPEEIARKYGLEKAAIDVELAVKKVLGSNRQAVDDLKRGEEKAVHFLVGQCMKETMGQVDAVELKRVIEKLAKNS